MKRLTLALIGAAALPAVAMADITVKYDTIPTQPVEYKIHTISEMLKPRGEGAEPISGTATLTDGKYVIPTIAAGPAQYFIRTGDRSAVNFYAQPGDSLFVHITSLTPLEYDVNGTRLMDEITALRNQGDDVMKKFRILTAGKNYSREDVMAIESDYNKIFTDFIAANPESPAVAYAVLNLEGEDFIKALDAMTPAAKESPLYALAAAQKEMVEQHIETEKRKAQLSSGEVEAPDFTFNNLEGKPVSLKDFRGKWVVIDFWGAWCPWCIKGFPALKEAYAKYKDKLEVIGLDCNDKPDAWKAAVKKYELPWVNVYNPDPKGGKVLEDYAVEGFPTKVIVNPEGRIVNITTGENPEFFEILDSLVK